MDILIDVWVAGLYVLLKARTQRPIFRGFAAELVVDSAYSIPESADSTTNSVMFNILNPLELADGSRCSLESADVKLVK